MQNVQIRLRNCYGIGELDCSLNFADGKPYAVYAPNGSMKTSLARTLMDLSQDQVSCDLLFPQRATERLVTDESGIPIPGENVFVVEPYNESFTSDRASMLMVNAALKTQFDVAVAAMEDAKERLIRPLKELSGLRGRATTPETEMVAAFNGRSFYEVVVALVAESPSPATDELADVTYNDVFNDKTLALLESGTIRNDLIAYMEKYQELVDASPVLSRRFNHYHAATVQRNLADNNFFEARHAVRLYNGDGHDEYASAEAFSQRLADETDRVLSDTTLRSNFERIEKKLKNADLRRLRDTLADHPFVLVRLANHAELRRDFWRAYVRRCQDLAAEVANAFDTNRTVIQATVDAAKSERTDWEAVVDVFNARFSVPFKLSVGNQDDVILRDAAPKVVFTFQDPNDQVNVADRASLLRVLSQGEKRALYLLNVLFELQARAANAGTTLVVVDDIADSFDYKNKYAIIEYLREQCIQFGYRMLFLSHNYDFHRAVSSRLGVPRDKRLFAERDGRRISLHDELYQNNPFNHWKRHLSNERFRIASIPFVRNLAEYCGKSQVEATLTALLHIKANTKSLTVTDLLMAFSQVVDGLPAIAAPNRLVLDEIYDTAANTAADTTTRAELESKVVLAIAIRLLAEEYVIAKIADTAFVAGITKNQTMQLTTAYRTKFPTDVAELSVLERVNLMTPENIHLNAFMFEPILDMGIDNLKVLYLDVKALTQ